MVGIVLAIIMIVASFGGGYLIGNNGSSNGDNSGDVYATSSTYTSGDGYVTQNFTKEPERVACGCSTFLNIMLYFGLDDKIVGLFYDEEEVAPEYKDRYDKILKRIGSDRDFIGKTDSATVTSWEPDLIVGWASGFKETSLGSYKYWNNNNCNIWALESMNGKMDIEAMVLDYINLGKIFHIEDKVDAFLKEFINKLGEVKGALSSNNVQVAMYDCLSSPTISEKGLWMYGKDTFAGVILDYIGVKNVFPDGGKIQLASVIDKAEDIDLLFFVCYGGCDHDTNYASWTSNEILASCPAIKNNHYSDIWLSLAYGGDPAVLDFLDNIYEMFVI